MNRQITLGIIALVTISLIGTAAAKSMDLSDIVGNDVYLYSGESLTFNNNQQGQHSITSTTGLFDSGLIDQGKQGNLDFKTRGTYQFFDSGNPGKVGTIHVIIPELKIQQNATAGSIFNINGIDFNSGETNIQILKPDGTLYQQFKINAASNGIVFLPVQTSRYDQNGTYHIRVLGYDSAQSDILITGGTTQDAPFEITPIVNGTVTEPLNTTESIPDSIVNNPVDKAIPPVITTFDKAGLIQYAKEQIKFWTQLLAFLEAS